jgi:hypothetical protein
MYEKKCLIGCLADAFRSACVLACSHYAPTLVSQIQPQPNAAFTFSSST